MLLLILALLPAPLWANDWAALDRPGAIAVMRHALAPGFGDPESFRLDDCSTQRLLDDAGRAQARAIGAALRDRGVRFDRVFTSQWCRTRETAELLDLGAPVPAPALNSFFQGRGDAARQTAEALDLIADQTGPVMLVTHQVNISALTGRSTRSGEVLVIRLGDSGVEVLGSILIAP
jgi:phosphohistidine phosphatase SixA